MAKQLPALTPRLQDSIERQPLFFVGTAAATGRINISLKGMASLRVLALNRIVWLNVTGSGNETAAHLHHSPQMTLMWCAFEGTPLILRTYGLARMVQPPDADWETYFKLFPVLSGARQIYIQEIELVQTSCGMAAPFMDYISERENLNHWARKKSTSDLAAYQRQKNSYSIDGFPTDLPADAPLTVDT